jgi:adenylate kinase family enzyme
MITFGQLGNRICIIGCSNSGKSTLADSLAKKLNINVHHLDQYAHVKNTKWIRQSDEHLINEHNHIINQETWIIEGNYSICMPVRLARATSVIWLDPNVYGSVLRYLLRAIKNDKERPGRLKGAKNEFRFWLIKWILFNYPKNRIKYEKLLDNWPNLLLLHISSMSLLNKYYKAWGLTYK